MPAVHASSPFLAAKPYWIVTHWLHVHLQQHNGQLLNYTRIFMALLEFLGMISFFLWYLAIKIKLQTPLKLLTSQSVFVPNHTWRLPPPEKPSNWWSNFIRDFRGIWTRIFGISLEISLVDFRWWIFMEKFIEDLLDSLARWGCWAKKHMVNGKVTFHFHPWRLVGPLFLGASSLAVLKLVAKWRFSH